MKACFIIFDLDGTLIDSAGDVRHAINLLLQEHDAGPLSLAAAKGMIGEGATALVQRAFAACELTTGNIDQHVRRYVELYSSEPVIHTKLYPGVQQTLRQLQDRGVTMAVCTNKPARLSKDVLERLGVAQYFSALASGDSHEFRKPDPRILHVLLKQFGVAPAEALMVGDSEIDSATAQAAGVPFVLMTYGYRKVPVDSIACTWAVDDFLKLLEIVEP